MNPLCEGQFNKDRVGVDFNWSRRKTEFFEKPPSNQKEQEVATEIEIYESSEYNFYFSFII